MEIEEKARLAKELRDSEAFQLFTSEFRESCMAAFANSTAEQSERREEAHAHLRALKQFEGQLDAAIDAQTLAERKAEKNGPRGNDR